MKTKNILKTNKSREIIRQCVICGEDIYVKVFSDGKYVGGNFFCEIKHAESYRETGETLDFRNGTKIPIAEPVGKIKKWEYWECDRCYNNPS